jgi:hypothetical protein
MLIMPCRASASRCRVQVTSNVRLHKDKTFTGREFLPFLKIANMKTRTVTLASGEAFSVPQGIQRLDSRSTRGWQVRYQGTKYFPDGEAGPQKALTSATKELLRRIAEMPAPAGLRRTTKASKSSGLPVGISGPLVVTKPGSSALSAILSIAVPQFGKPNLTRKIHIGTPSTYTKTKYKQALVKAIEIRELGMAQYEAAATLARRSEATKFKRSLRSAASGA